MATIKIKRGLETNRPSYTPVEGELIWTTDAKDLWIGDGSTAGGLKITANVENWVNSTFIPLSQKGAADGVASLGSDGKIPSSQLPAIAITETFVVDSESAQLALDAQEGDIAIRTDENKSYVHNGGTAGNMTDWTELLSPGDTAVQTVNGKAGPNVTLTTDDISEGTTNLYYTDARVQTVIGNSSIGDLSDVTLSSPAADQVLSFDGSTWKNVDMSTVGRTTFVALDDTPSSYASGDAGKFVRVNAAEDALEFATAAVSDLSDVNTSGAATGDYLEFDGTNWVPSSTIDGGTF